MIKSVALLIFSICLTPFIPLIPPLATASEITLCDTPTNLCGPAFQDNTRDTANLFGETSPDNPIPNTLVPDRIFDTDWQHPTKDLPDGPGEIHHRVDRYDPYHTHGATLEFDVHHTQECGNKILVTAQVPEPATMLLLGMGLLGIGAIGRRFPIE